MKLHILGSSSAGNCYILESNTSAFVIEAGVTFKEVKKALNFNSSKIEALIYSHIHGDHYKFIDQYLLYGIKCYGNDTDNTHTHHCLLETGTTMLGEFHVLPFELSHNVPCNGFKISHKDMGSLVFITDSNYCPYKFSGINHWLVECNHSREILDKLLINGGINEHQHKRVINDHMSLETLQLMLEANNLDVSRNIILTHLSDNNSNSEHFKSEVMSTTGVPVYVASKGLKLDLTL